VTELSGSPSTARRPRGWLALLPVLPAMFAVVAALALPSPAPIAVAGAPAAAGPIRLHDAWPSANVASLDATVSQGLAFEPMYPLDKATTVGLATTADRSVNRLVVRRDGLPLLVLRVLRSADLFYVVTVVAAGDQVFWLESGSNAAGQGTTRVWRADLRTGSARQVATDTSDLLFFGSQYDLEVVGGRLYWAASLPGDRSEILSVSVHGGPIQRRAFDRVYSLTEWPWVTTSGSNGMPGDGDLLNLTTGEHRTVSGGPNQYLNCTPTWCRMTTLIDNNSDLNVTLQHPDGSGAVKISSHGQSPVNTDVALVGRFEVFESPGSTTAANPVQKLWLHDLGTGRDVLLDERATGLIGSRNGFLWWSTGDNEATVWHLLDLRQLT
jgi:hypothetical protein